MEPNNTGSAAHTAIPDAQLKKYSKLIGMNWELMAVGLGLTQSQVNSLKTNYMCKIETLLYTMIKRWHDAVVRCGEDPRRLLAASFASEDNNEAAVEIVGQDLLADVKDIRPSKRTEEAIQQISFDLGAQPEPAGQVNLGAYQGSSGQVNLGAYQGSSGQVNYGAPGSINVFPGSEVNFGGHMTVRSSDSSSGAQGSRHFTVPGVDLSAGRDLNFGGENSMNVFGSKFVTEKMSHIALGGETQPKICRGELDEVDSAVSKRPPCSSRHELKKEHDDTLNQNQVMVLGEMMKSVCAIVYPGGHGTAFRVGDKYLLTAWHVVRDLVNTEGVSLETHTRVNFSVDLKFNATTTIDYKLTNNYIENKALDVVFLEIKNPDENLPRPLPLYGQPIDTNMSSVALMGYGRPENDNTKQLDPGCPVVPQCSTNIQDAQCWLATNEQQLRNDFLSKHKNPDLLNQSYEGFDQSYNMIINCYLEKGASGAPMIDYRNPASMSVVGVLTQGLPKCFWDMPKQSQEKFPQRFRLEVGTRMASIKAYLMQAPPNVVNPDFVKQLFP